VLSLALPRKDRAKYAVVTLWILVGRTMARDLSVLAMMVLTQMPNQPLDDLSPLSGGTTVNREELRRFGRAARNSCLPEANRGKQPREEFVIQLEEAQAEWKQRFEPSLKHRD